MAKKTAIAFLLLGATYAQLPVVTQFPVTTQTSFAPTPGCTSGAATEQFTVNYNFESATPGDPITGIVPINVYNLLNFSHINYVNTDPDFDGNHLGLAPHTYPDAATFGAGTNTLFGQTPVITAGYIESTLTSFTPRSFWYGCVLPSPYTAGSLPHACNITATGFSKSGSQIASQNFAFKTNGSVVQDQVYGAFNGFNNIYSLQFSVSDNSSAAALIDNFIATLSQPSCAPYYLGSYNNGT
ncbi:hypothetical protein AC579_10038 [Pseudocercospora musae]|uniref:Uncharacterized protein n=1 Tax=Pseudocercospora musae TaxID=113226 RepID=A0A139IHE6_9PEZI|nr:hypothetical protein AC579_10038 [Pseudocercospora musae]